MKTQISQLRSGIKNQMLNTEIDYSSLSKGTSPLRHSGTSIKEVEDIWKKVISENPESMKIVIKGIEIELKANWSLSGKSVSYNAEISKKDLIEKFNITPAERQTPSISIQNGNIIVVSNDKNSYTHLCPSLIEIL